MKMLLRIGIAAVFLIAGQLHSAVAQSDNPSIRSPLLAAD